MKVNAVQYLQVEVYNKEIIDSFRRLVISKLSPKLQKYDNLECRTGGIYVYSWGGWDELNREEPGFVCSEDDLKLIELLEKVKTNQQVLEKQTY